MKDTIIKGNGRSRIVKAPDDMPGTYSEWRTSLIAGTGYLDTQVNTDVSSVTAGLDTLGTPLNKANLLDDATKTMLGLTQTDPTVNEALYKLGYQSKMGLQAIFYAAGSRYTSVILSNVGVYTPIEMSEIRNLKLGDDVTLSMSAGKITLSGTGTFGVTVSASVGITPNGQNGSRGLAVRMGSTIIAYARQAFASGATTDPVFLQIPETYIGNIVAGSGTTIDIAYSGLIADVFGYGTSVPQSVYATVKAYRVS